MATQWMPEGAIRITAGTPLGGGLDRVARALERAIAQSGGISVPVEVENIPGDGARRVWRECIDAHPGDGHVVSISSPNLTTDYLAGIADFEHTRYTPIATLVSEYIAFAVRADSLYASGRDLVAWFAEAPNDVTVALSTALGNPNHIALAKLMRAAGGDVNAPVVRVFDTALDAVADVVEGHADVCAVTVASVIAELEVGNLRMLATSSPERLSGLFADTPTWAELGIDCDVGAWRGVTGPADMPDNQAVWWRGILRNAVAQDVWVEELARMNWTAMYLDGEALQTHLSRERAEYVAILRELGLLNAPA